jgi:hypothetical protein
VAISEELLRVRLLDAKKAEVELRKVREELEATTGATEDSSVANDEAAASSGRLKGAFSGLKSALVYGGSLIGIGAVGYGLKDLVEGGQKAQEQTLLLRNALKSTGQEGSGHLNLINKAIGQSSTRGGFSKLEETQGIAELVRETQSATAAIKDNASAVTLARGAHESYASALSQVEKVQTGSVGRLQKLVGPFVASKYYIDQLTASEKKRFPQKVKEAEVLDKEATAREFNRRILERYGSAVNSYNKSTAGSISNANNAFKNATDQLGEKLLPAEKAVAQWFGKTVTEIMKGEGAWKKVGKDIEGVWHALEKVYEFLDHHHGLAEALGYGAAVTVGGHFVKKVPGAGLASKLFKLGTSGAAEGGEGAAVGAGGFSTLADAAAFSTGVGLLIASNKAIKAATEAITPGYLKQRSLGDYERALFGGGNVPLNTQAGGRSAGGNASEAALISRILTSPNLLTPKTVLSDHELTALQQAVERGMASHVSEIHMDSVKLGQALRRNPGASRELSEAVTAHAQKRRARE